MGILSSACFAPNVKPKSESGAREEATKQPEASEPEVQCDDFEERPLKRVDQEFRPGLSAETILESLVNPVELAFRADQENPFELTPNIDGKQAIFSFQHNGGPITLAFWRQRDEALGARLHHRKVECWDELRIPADLEIRTDDGLFRDRISGLLNLRVPAGLPFDSQQLEGDFMSPPRALHPIRDRFTASEPEIAPEHELSGWRFDLYWTIKGDDANGLLLATWLVDVSGSEANRPDFREISSRYRITPPRSDQRNELSRAGLGHRTESSCLHH